MGISRVWIKGLPPFPDNKSFSWDTSESRVLLYGVSGSGKTTAFRVIARLWRAFGAFLTNTPIAPLASKGSAAVLFTYGKGKLLLASGDGSFIKDTHAQCPASTLFAITNGGATLTGEVPNDLANLCLADGDWHEKQALANARDAWFLTDDDVMDCWPQLLNEALLAGDPHGLQVQSAIQSLLYNKTLKASPSGLEAHVPHGGVHDPMLLSMGERRVCLLCVMAGLCLKPGGILMLDEPDVHLHPSQVLGMLSTIENLALAKEGQIFLISHRLEVWRRYDTLGLALEMEGKV